MTDTLHSNMKETTSTSPKRWRRRAFICLGLYFLLVMTPLLLILCSSLMPTGSALSTSILNLSFIIGFSKVLWGSILLVLMIFFLIRSLRASNHVDALKSDKIVGGLCTWLAFLKFSVIAVWIWSFSIEFAPGQSGVFSLFEQVRWFLPVAIAIVIPVAFFRRIS
jgi:hypothetical protein